MHGRRAARGPRRAAWPGVARVAVGALAWAWVGVSALPMPSASASPVDMAGSLARGVAWIWPASNGPRPAGNAAPYREAAVLVESLVLRARTVEFGGRDAPLPLPPRVRVLPVIHVEAASDAPSELAPAQRDAILAAVCRHTAAARGGAGVLQLDFEAPPRQREAYRGLVAAVRHSLPADVRLSVTALAHWCTQGDWLDRLPVDEVVPMLYRLGPHAAQWLRRFEQPGPHLARRCRGPALGFSVQEPPPRSLLDRTSRSYWFDHTAWSNPSLPLRHLLP